MQVSPPILPESETLYWEMRAKMDRAKTAVVRASNIHSERELTYTYGRGGKGSLHGMSNGFVTDGRWTYQDDDNGFLDRKAQANDVKRKLGLPGMESFWNPNAKVIGKRKARYVTQHRTELIDLELWIDGRTISLYLDAKTRLPAGFSEKPHVDREHFYLVELDPKLPKDVWRIVRHPGRSQVER